MLQHEQEALGVDAWEAAAPLLNDALASLGAADRECVLLRFLEGLSLAEVGARLGVPENTARMRVTRAVEKMRRHLSAGSVILAAPALAALLLERAAPPAPAASVAAASLLPLPGVAALQPSLASVRAAQLTEGVLIAMKIKSATVAVTVVVAAFSLIAGGFVLEKRHQEQAAQGRAVQQAQGLPVNTQQRREQTRLEYERAMAQSNQIEIKARRRLKEHQ